MPDSNAFTQWEIANIAHSMPVHDEPGEHAFPRGRSFSVPYPWEPITRWDGATSPF